MKRLLIAAALGSSAMAGTADAQDTGPYITIEGGAVKQERSDVRLPTGPARTDRFDTGWEAGGSLGYDFGHFRLEAEGFYARSRLKSQHRDVAGTPTVLTRDAGMLGGNTSTWAAMGNALIGVGHWGGVKAYVGAGAGWARTRLYEVTAYNDDVKDSYSGFA